MPEHGHVALRNWQKTVVNCDMRGFPKDGKAEKKRETKTHTHTKENSGRRTADTVQCFIELHEDSRAHFEELSELRTQEETFGVKTVDI